jgi:hypothetical protein
LDGRRRELSLSLAGNAIAPAIRMQSAWPAGD